MSPFASSAIPRGVIEKDLARRIAILRQGIAEEDGLAERGIGLDLGIEYLGLFGLASRLKPIGIAPIELAEDYQRDAGESAEGRSGIVVGLFGCHVHASRRGHREACASPAATTEPQKQEGGREPVQKRPASNEGLVDPNRRRHAKY